MRRRIGSYPREYLFSEMVYLKYVLLDWQQKSNWFSFVLQEQFDVVLREELPLILKAFKSMETAQRKKYRPTLSIVICG